MGKIIVETPRLLLREFDENDVAAFHVLGSDPRIIRYTGEAREGLGLKSLDHARQVLRDRPLADYRKYGYGRWACVWKETGAVIGFAGLKYLDDLGATDIGYRFIPEFWGRGIATEASRAALEDGFTRLGLTEIIGLVEPENVASVRVLQKLGLRLVGPIDYRGGIVDKYVVTRG
jgi:RimJ/RimL family protein N-acetyltransferase